MATGKIHHTLKGFTGKPSSLAWNPSGKTLAVVGLEGSEYTTSIWDINSGKKQKSFKEASSIQSVAWSLNGKRLASGGDTMTVRNPVTGKTLYTYPSRDISWNPTISKWADGSKVVDSEAGQTIINFTTLGGQVGAVWSPDGKRLASFNHTKLQVWDLPEVSIPIYFKKLYTLKTGVEEERGFSIATKLEEREDERQTYMEWGPKGKQLVNRLSDGTIVIWNTDTGKKHVVIKGFRIGSSRHYHGEIFWSPSGNRIAAFEVDYFKANILKVWDTATGENIYSVKSKKGDYIQAPFGWSPNGNKLACLTQSRDNFYINIIDSGKGTVVKVHEVKDIDSIDPVISWSPDGKRLAVSGTKFTNKEDDEFIEGYICVSILDAINGQEIKRIKSDNTDGEEGLQYLKWSRDGAMIFGHTEGYDLFKVWDVAKGIERLSLEVPFGFSINYAGDKLAIDRGDQELEIIGISAGRKLPLPVDKEKDYSIRNVSLSPNGRFLATAGVDQRRGLTEVDVYDLKAGKVIQVFTFSGIKRKRLAPPAKLELSWNTESRRLAFRTLGGEITIWQLQGNLNR